MKKLLQFYLFDDWTSVFGSYNLEREVELSTEDYVIALEILSEADSIPHDFKTLLFYLFTDSENQGFKKMWDSKFVKRTSVALSVIFKKSLKNRYVPDSEPFIELEPSLEKLRQVKINCANYLQAKKFYERLQLIFENEESAKLKEVGELVDSWY